MKLLMNFMAMGYAALYSEATVLGAKVGISPQIVRQVIGSSRLGNGFFDTFMKYTVDRDRNAHLFTITNASKDVRYLANMAADARVLKDPAPQTMVGMLNASSVDITMRCWCKTDDYWGVFFDLTENSKAAIEGAGMSIPYPQQDVHIISQPKAAD